MSETSPSAMEATIPRFFDACNAADYDALMSCFSADAVHHFPPGLPDIPRRGAETIARKWIWRVENLDSQWTFEKILCSSMAPEAVIEWTHWKRKRNTALRGDEWYVFDAASGLIKEISAYYAAPADPSAWICELVAFDYRGRGYHLGNK
ncbi:nuclear transport factor 2 family protein [Bradyrhizobium sp. KB893862 SZCCT0404]|nr:nuclear transport factor 2 family protein [Bradyrhizobium sp. KB893862 SZCCT0404]